MSARGEETSKWTGGQIAFQLSRRLLYLAPLCLSVSLVALAVEPEIVSDRENEREVVGVGRAGWLAAWTRERVGQRGGGRARAEQDEE